jgi:hypothetical protein
LRPKIRIGIEKRAFRQEGLWFLLVSLIHHERKTAHLARQWAVSASPR